MPAHAAMRATRGLLMSEEQSLQFDRAEFDQAPSGTQCAECHRALTASYFDVNGQVVCEACRYTIEARMNAGSSIGRFTKAAGAGFIAAVLGAVLYYAIAAMTGYEFGLIAIVVGFGVGTAVRWGSNGRGGWKYQALAMALTYLAIVGTYIPPIIQGFREASSSQSQPAASPDGSAAPAATPVSVTTSEPAAPPTAGEMALALAFLLAIACVAPFLAGFENVIGIVIIGIGLYEAWKLNRRVDLVITGPHMLGRAPAESAAV
jgi:hypothetical protein